MEIPKDMILTFIEQRMGADQASQADTQLPDTVDHEQHAGILNQLGVQPQELLAHVGTRGDGGLADEAKGLLGGSGGAAP